MSRASLLERPAAATARPEEEKTAVEVSPACRSTDERRPPGGEWPTLGDVVTGAWEGLLAAGSADCPLCGQQMEMREGAGRCKGCGSILS